MLVVSQTHRIRAQVHEQIEVLLLIGARHGPAFDRAILVHGSAPQRDVLAIQEEPRGGVESHLAQAQRLTHPVEHVSLWRAQRHDHAI